MHVKPGGCTPLGGSNSLFRLVDVLNPVLEGTDFPRFRLALAEQIPGFALTLWTGVEGYSEGMDAAVVAGGRCL